MKHLLRTATPGRWRAVTTVTAAGALAAGALGIAAALPGTNTPSDAIELTSANGDLGALVQDTSGPSPISMVSEPSASEPSGVSASEPSTDGPSLSAAAMASTVAPAVISAASPSDSSASFASDSSDDDSFSDDSFSDDSDSDD
jgi:hypothetical protein